VIKIDATILIQFVNFIILMVVLNIFLYRPLRSILGKRKETIENSVQGARELEVQIEAKMNRYQQQLLDAKAKGNQERSAMRQAAAEEEANILGDAHTSATDQVRSVKEKVATEAEAARSALRSETAALAEQIASKVLGRAV
jgi:F-type H+-transporting ATPase subunit b